MKLTLQRLVSSRYGASWRPPSGAFFFYPNCGTACKRPPGLETDNMRLVQPCHSKRPKAPNPRNRKSGSTFS